MPGPPRNEEFTRTQWTLVGLAALEDGSAAARQALERLCTRYWPSIYGCLRRQGRQPAEAEDLTQGFLSELPATNALRRADRAKGRFRNFSPQVVPAVVCRFRERYRELVRRTVLVTVADVEQVDSEFQELFR